MVKGGETDAVSCTRARLVLQNLRVNLAEGVPSIDHEYIYISLKNFCVNSASCSGSEKGLAKLDKVVHIHVARWCRSTCGTTLRQIQVKIVFLDVK